MKVGTVELGLTLSCKSTLLANDKSQGKLIVSHLETDGVPICLRTAATDLGIDTAAGKRRCAASQWKRIWKGRQRAKRVDRLCKMNSEAQKLTMRHSPCSNLRSHSARSIQRTGRRHVQRSEVGHGFGKDPSIPYHHSRMVFRSKRVKKMLPGLSKSASGFQCGEIVMSTQDAESADFGGKRPHVGRKSPSLESGYGTYLCHHLLGVGRWMEAELTRFLAVTGWQCHSGRRLVLQGADHRQFLQ